MAVPPVKLVCAFNAKGPMPEPGRGARLAQREAARNDLPSTASVPSILNEGFWLIAPSKASLNGLPESRSFRPERSPDSAANRSPAVALASNASPRQMKRPVAPKLRAIDGQANDSVTSDSSSDM